MQSTTDAKQRVVYAAAELLARHGLNGSSIREVIKHADAPFGSTYHHFPGGKQQIVQLAVEYTTTQVAVLLQQFMQAGLAAGYDSFCQLWRQILTDSAFSRGCPVLAAAVEAPVGDSDTPVLAAAERAFAHWQQLLQAALEQHGHDEAAARGLAALWLAAIEGAVVLCRAKQDITPFELVCQQLRPLLLTPSSSKK